MTGHIETKVNIIGAGLAGLSAAIHLAYDGIGSRLISLQPSERAQSVMAEGGINAALDTMDEGDDPMQHYEDTLKGGVYLADEDAVWNLTREAPATVRWLVSLGVPFNMKGSELVLRNFGGQKKKRTAYSKSSTGKILMSALIDEARKYEACGLIERMNHHQFCRLWTDEEESVCLGVVIKDAYDTGAESSIALPGKVILCSGGMNSLFPGLTTGTTVNTGDVTATVFTQGVSLANLEFIQYHPTTAAIPGKRCLITEAARGEGGRLFVYRGEEKWYYMEEKFPELGNLMPRDVVSRETVKATETEGCEGQAYLDMTHLGNDIWEDKLSDLREECIRLLATDPKTDYLKVTPGIHFFMGGIKVDKDHRTSMPGLYAAGECACIYHGANRLGGNSMLGAVFGGKTAARSVRKEADVLISESVREETDVLISESIISRQDYAVDDKVAEIMRSAMGIFRTEKQLTSALDRLNGMDEESLSGNDRNRLLLAKAIVMSALNRRESRGAHTRLDYPERNDEMFQKQTVVTYDDGEIKLQMEAVFHYDKAQQNRV